MKIKASDALNLLGALSQLDGYSKVVKDGTSEKIVQSGFTLSAKTKLSIALTRKRVGVFVSEVIEQRNELIRSLSGGGESVTEVSGLADLRVREKELMDFEEDINISQISVDDLHLDDENNRNISPSLIIMIEPILKDFENYDKLPIETN